MRHFLIFCHPISTGISHFQMTFQKCMSIELLIDASHARIQKVSPWGGGQLTAFVLSHLFSTEWRALIPKENPVYN